MIIDQVEARLWAEHGQQFGDDMAALAGRVAETVRDAIRRTIGATRLGRGGPLNRTAWLDPQR